MDLDDARRSRRDLQHKLNASEQHMKQVNGEYDTLMV